jgi:N-methylhydantoinase B
MERMRFPPYGVAGGRPGAPFRAVFNKGRTNERRLAKIDQLTVGAGDTVTFMLPGASGYGDPFRRPPAKVLEDVILGFVSPAAAKSDYGVVIVDGNVDAAATRRRRGGRRPARPDFDFGSEREAWESVFDDAVMEELNRRLFLLPPARRSATRRRIFVRAVPDLPPVGGTPLAQAMAKADEARARLRRAMDEILGPAGATPPRPLRRAGSVPWPPRRGR